MTERAIEDIQFDIAQIDHLLVSYATLFVRVRQAHPDLIEMTAVASVLHSFYNGLELIFLSIAKRLDGNVPTGERWHKAFLLQMMQSTEQRAKVLSAESAQQIEHYLGFRHFYRHSYSFFLEWTELEKLFSPLESIWSQVKAELIVFLDTLSPA